MSDVRPRSDALKDLAPKTPRAVFAAVIAAAIVLTLRHGLGSALILLAGAALLMFIWLAFRAVGAVTEPDARSILIELPPTPAQARKTTALRALKDLEFEKAIGNLNDADYADLEGRYREEAKRAMREVDDERKELRARAEALAQRALGARATGATAAPKALSKLDTTPPDPTPTPAAAPASIRASREKLLVCKACDTKNEPDARFCKQCGAKMQGAS
jgi:hypothetical protein